MFKAGKDSAAERVDVQYSMNYNVDILRLIWLYCLKIVNILKQECLGK